MLGLKPSKFKANKIHQLLFVIDEIDCCIVEKTIEKYFSYLLKIACKQFDKILKLIKICTTCYTNEVITKNGKSEMILNFEDYIDLIEYMKNKQSCIEMQPKTIPEIFYSS